MRRRVMTVYVTLLVVAGLGLALPLCASLVARATADMVLDRTNDSARFAGLAEPSVVTSTPGIMSSELAAYEQVYGITAAVLDADGAIIAASRADLTLADLGGADWDDPDQLPAVLRSALAGNRSGAGSTVWPWENAPLIVAEPVGSSGEVVGVVVTASPTGALQRATLRQWALVWAGVAVLLAAGIVAAGPLTRWALRPIADLDHATNAISQGSLNARVPVHAGPPELQRLGDSFNAMAETITTLLHRQRTFVAYAGHQVRNPLAALRIRVESLGQHLPEMSTEDHSLALEEVDRLARTCDSLLTLAQAEDGEVSRVRVQVDEIARRRVQGWRPIAQRADATLTYVDGPAIEVRSLEGSLDQALDALIDNALKFGGQGVQVSVSVRAMHDGGVEIQVLDDGPGLPAARLARAARPFWHDEGESDESGSAAGGTGLGLSIVVTLLELQGGELALSAASPHGVDARIRIPDRRPRRSRT